MAAGEQGILANRSLAAQNVAQQNLASALTTQQQRGGFTEAAGALAQPQPYGITTTPYSAATGYASGGGTFPNYQTGTNVQFNTATGQALGRQANDLQTAMNQTDQNFQTVNSLFKNNNLNLTDFPDFNSLTNFLQSHGVSAGVQTSAREALNALQSSIGNIINSSGAFTPTEVTDLSKQVSAANLSPAQLQTLYNPIRQTAATRVNTTLQEAQKYEQAGGSSVTANTQPLSGASQNLNGTNTPQEGSTASNGEFVYKNGQWTLAK